MYIKHCKENIRTGEFIIHKEENLVVKLNNFHGVIVKFIHNGAETEMGVYGEFIDGEYHLKDAFKKWILKNYDAIIDFEFGREELIENKVFY